MAHIYNNGSGLSATKFKYTLTHFPIMFDITGLGWFVDFFLSFTEKLIFQNKKKIRKKKEFSDARAFVSSFTLHVTVVLHRLQYRH